MGLRDELTNLQRGPKCGVTTTLQSLPPSLAGELQELLADDTVAASSLARLCIDKGWPIKQHTIAKHRRGECACH
jgi:hypothetical protein